jgi:hypothetical protein
LEYDRLVMKPSSDVAQGLEVPRDQRHAGTRLIERPRRRCADAA